MTVRRARMELDADRTLSERHSAIAEAASLRIDRLDGCPPRRGYRAPLSRLWATRASAAPDRGKTTQGVCQPRPRLSGRAPLRVAIDRADSPPLHAMLTPRPEG